MKTKRITRSEKAATIGEALGMPDGNGADVQCPASGLKIDRGTCIVRQERKPETCVSGCGELRR